MEAILTSIISGGILGGIIGFVLPYIVLKSIAQKDGPNEWMHRHRNLNIALIQLRRTTEVKEEMTSSRQKNLQLQMNPHFIFNALTGINMLLLREETENALIAIKKFRGLLIRSWGNALENPREVFNSTLSEEISFLQDYVELEQMRLSTEVAFIITGNELLGEDYPIPNFLIQPLIENALWHGLEDKEGSIIELSFTPDTVSGMLMITVADNGKGISDNSNSDRKSFGLQILKERLLLISYQSSLTIRNREDQSGCKAIISIPLIKQ